MSHSRRIPLNPCDYLFFAHHRLIERRTRAGYTAVMCLEVRGHPDPRRVRMALGRALASHPVTLAGIRISRLLARPYWKLPRAEDMTSLVDRAYTFHDLRQQTADGADALPARCEIPNGKHWDLHAGPPVRFEQYAMPSERTVFFLRWSHVLMDAAGGQILLSEIQRCDAASGGESHREFATEDEAAHSSPPDVDVLADRGLLERVRLFRAGLADQRRISKLWTRPIVSTDRNGASQQRVLQTYWTGNALGQLKSNARRWAPAGPGLYARFLAACVFRALHEIYRLRRVETGYFVIPLPLSVASAGDGELSRAARPLAGNYLVSPNLVIPAHEAADMARVGVEIARQLSEYHAQEGNLAQWAAMWMAGKMRTWMYDLMLRLPIGFGSMSSGFSYYGETNPPIRRIAGTEVTNLWGAAPMGTPPGWNPAFSRFADKLNFTMTYDHPTVSDELAREYVGLIEEAALRG